MRTGYIVLLLCGVLFAQNPKSVSGTITSAGYIAPFNILKTAPGQVVSLVVHGLDRILDQPVTATGTPLPLTLAGLSVSFYGDVDTLPAPLLGISQEDCAYPNAGAGLCDLITLISIQMPFEIQPDCVTCERPPSTNFFVVASAGVPKAIAATVVLRDNIHITNNCDTTVNFSQLGHFNCGQIVAHSDGTRVDFYHRAKVGEELVMYAFGLGQTNPLVKSGTVTPSPAPQLPTSQFGLNFNYTPNAAPSVPNLPGTPWFDYTPPSPVYVALVSGFVGLYQVNFVVPPAPAVTPYVPCSGSVNWNLMVTLFTANSFDGAGICVQTQ
jgi:uncharacterized protein (TIGR03437 family)